MEKEYVAKWPQAWEKYLFEFHMTRDYFECHEILEEYWKDQSAIGMKEDHWIAWIQLAVGSYHARRGNWAGALKMLNQAKSRLSDLTNLTQELGVDAQQLSQRMDDLISGAAKIEPAFLEMEIPILDLSLKESVIGRNLNLKWGVSSTDIDRALWDKHRLRDRSDVIAARLASLQTKNRTIQ